MPRTQHAPPAPARLGYLQSHKSARHRSVHAWFRFVIVEAATALVKDRKIQYAGRPIFRDTSIPDQMGWNERGPCCDVRPEKLCNHLQTFEHAYVSIYQVVTGTNPEPYSRSLDLSAKQELDSVRAWFHARLRAKYDEPTVGIILNGAPLAL